LEISLQFSYVFAASPVEREAVSDHVVQFYSSDDFLTQEVARFFQSGFPSGDVCLMIATEPHRRGVARRLGPDADRVVFLDAAEQLERFDVGGGIDFEAFERTVGATVTRAGAEGARVRTFGEMVALLMERDRRQSAIDLEGHWNGVMQREPLELLCAYPLAAFDGHDSRAHVQSVCRVHTHVRSADRPTALDDVVSFEKLAAEVRQKNAALEREGAEPHRLERAVEKQHMASPANAPAAASGRAAAHRPSVRQVIPRRVLVVDDDPQMAETMARWLRSAGHAVQVASDGASAIAEVVSTRPDIVLLDIAMPKIDGYEVARRLRALPALHACVLVALTGLADPDDVARAQRAGFDHHLAKPPDLARLEALLRSGI
jgi:CheY-like chemotaxis protein